MGLLDGYLKERVRDERERILGWLSVVNALSVEYRISNVEPQNFEVGAFGMIFAEMVESFGIRNSLFDILRFQEHG